MELEAKALTALQHPNIVTIYEANITGLNTLWMGMEFLDGVTIRSELKERGAMSVPDALFAIRELAKGLAAAHEFGIVHRDMKPENAFLTRSGQFKVLDFGISKFSKFAMRLTDPGQAPGTPAYMSPEQVAGREVDARSDVYALALIGYELFTGMHVFGPRFHEERNHVLATWHALRPPVSLAEVRPGLPSSVVRIIEGALSKDPALRPQNMAAFARQCLHARIAFLDKNPRAQARFLLDGEEHPLLPHQTTLPSEAVMPRREAL